MKVYKLRIRKSKIDFWFFVTKYELRYRIHIIKKARISLRRNSLSKLLLIRNNYYLFEIAYISIR